jgi:hypothetical protein
MAAKHGPLAPPEFFDFPPVDINVENEIEVSNLLDRVVEIVFGGQRKPVPGVLMRKPQKRMARKKAKKAKGGR